jgi:hypothetical protein
MACLDAYLYEIEYICLKHLRASLQKRNYVNRNQMRDLLNT